MKFIYEYRTSDNVSRRGEVSATDRDAAFALLRKRGIRASRMAPAPGLLNLLCGCGKRWIAIVLLSIAAMSAVVYAFRIKSTSINGLVNLDSTTRRQVIGDAAVIEKGIKTGWSEVFDMEGDRFLASFAIPGVPAGIRSTTEEEVLMALQKRRVPREDDSIEARQVCAMVEGMKDELRRFISNGGSVRRYGERLVQRQEQELAYYNNAKREIEEAFRQGMGSSELESLWERRNASLRGMGIRLISMPGNEESAL